MQARQRGKSEGPPSTGGEAAVHEDAKDDPDA
jgi:hypothetical protein